MVSTAKRFPLQVRGLTMSIQAAIEDTACLPRPLGGRGGRMESAVAAQYRGLKDIALTSTMRDGLLRGHETSSLTWDDIEVREDGSGLLRIVGSKLNHRGMVHEVYLSRRCVEALMAIRPENPKLGESMFGLSRSQISRRIRAAAFHAGQGDGFCSRSPRIGMCQDLIASGVDTVSLMTAARWPTSAMPKQFIGNSLSARNVVAQWYHKRAEGTVEQEQSQGCAGGRCGTV